MLSERDIRELRLQIEDGLVAVGLESVVDEARTQVTDDGDVRGRSAEIDRIRTLRAGVSGYLGNARDLAIASAANVTTLARQGAVPTNISVLAPEENQVVFETSLRE